MSDPGLPPKPVSAAAGYASWPRLPDLYPLSFPGVKTGRDDVVVDIDRDRLVRRMQEYFNPQLSNEETRQRMPAAMRRTERFDGEAVRGRLTGRGFLPDRVVNYYYRPFDRRWLYCEPEAGLLDGKYEDHLAAVREGNQFLFATGKVREGPAEPALVVHDLTDLNCLEMGARGFPLYRRADEPPPPGAPRPPNLSPRAMEYLTQLHAKPEDLFYHVLAILHAPAYRAENSAALGADWPRIVLPAALGTMLGSVASGRQAGALLDIERPLPGVTTGQVRSDLLSIAVFERSGGESAEPETGDLDATVGWGRPGKNGAVMPGPGSVTDNGAVLDINLNPTAGWRNVPKAVWEYTLGGHQVIKKWLSYREKAVLGRSLQLDEVNYVTEMARRIAALLGLAPALDRNYSAVKDRAHRFAG